MCRPTIAAKWIEIVSACVFWTAVAVAAQAATYYVAPAGDNETGDGSKAKPWAAVDYADRQGLLKPGDTVVVLPGTYELKTPVGISIARCSGSPGRPITYMADGAVTLNMAGCKVGVAIGGSSALKKIERPHFAIRGFGNYTVLEGLAIEGELAEADSSPLRLDRATGCEVVHCKIATANWTNQGVLLSQCVECRLHHNTISAPATGPNNAPSAGITEIEGSDNQIVNNTFWKVSGWALNVGQKSTGLGLYNNLVYQCGMGITSPETGVEHDRNVLFGCTTPFAGGFRPRMRETTTVDPLVDEKLRPKPESPVIDAGYRTELPYEGLCPDVGAIEAPGKIMRCVFWNEGSDHRWQNDLRDIKKAGIDGVWTVNPMLDYREQGSDEKINWYVPHRIPRGPFKEQAIKHLKQRVAYAESVGIKLFYCMAYSNPLPVTLLDDSEFAHYLEWVDRIVKETAPYHNIWYIFCDEELHTGWFAKSPDYPELIAHHKQWCRRQNPDINYWNARWGTNYTWDTIMPAPYVREDTDRHADYLRWMWGLIRPRIVEVGRHVKALAPHAPLGWHEWLLHGRLPGAEDTVLAGNEYFDFASCDMYNGPLNTRQRVAMLRWLFPGRGLWIGELGGETEPKHDVKPVETGRYLESQNIGYNLWQWYGAWGVVDKLGARRTTTALFPNMAKYGSIRGVITDASVQGEKKKIVVRAAVTAGGDLFGQTTSAGAFRMDADPGKYTVTLAHVGYEAQTIPNVAVRADKDTDLDIAMTPVVNLVKNPGFEGALKGWACQVVRGQKTTTLEETELLEPSRGFYGLLENDRYLVLGVKKAPAVAVACQDIAVKPDTAYRLTWWQKVFGEKFDGPDKEDQKFSIVVCQKQDQPKPANVDNTSKKDGKKAGPAPKPAAAKDAKPILCEDASQWTGPVVNAYETESSNKEWKRMETKFTTAPNVKKIQLRFEAKMASEQDYTGAVDAAHVEVDCVQLIPPQK